MADHEDNDDDHHHHSTVAVTLPLRLASEPYAKQDISSSCVSLGIHHVPNSSKGKNNVEGGRNVELAMIVEDDGIHAFCCSHLMTRTELLQRIRGAVPTGDTASTGWNTNPLLILVRDYDDTRNPNQMRWHYYEDSSDKATPIPQQQKEHLQNFCKPVHNRFVAQLVTNSIRQYYQQQILEPSVRGFLSVLEKQFARSDLYLFELLQNAVDDGASVVEFKLREMSRGSTSSSLQMIHNGRQFTPLDVLGLSSVGLSTKSRQGKRTIGFMGVGFKAVYKRYSRVVIDDGVYKFVYQEPKQNNMGYGWVMLPLWQLQKGNEMPQGESEDDRSKWCHFSLEQPRGGSLNIKRDLQVLPRTAPPLLGRAALVKMDGRTESNPRWILDWNGKRHTIERTKVTSYSSNHTHGSELVVVSIENNTQKSTVVKNWLFVTHKYRPSAAARETYRNHTKRSQEGYEEICGFVPLLMSTKSKDNADTTSSANDDEYVPQTLPLESRQAASSSSSGWINSKRSPQISSSLNASSPSGWIHSVLPTKIKMPVPIHFQGSWLLSVDRQHVQDLTDNAWNAEVLSKFPNLIATIWRWTAQNKIASPKHYQAICELLPSTTKTPAKGRSSAVDILGQTVSLQALEQAFWSEPILPVGIKTIAASPAKKDNCEEDAMEVDSTNENTKNKAYPAPVISTRYYEGSNTIWVPPSWFEFLDTAFLRGWLGKRPLRTDLMGKAAYHPLFGLNHVVEQLSPLPTRTSQLGSELGIRLSSGSRGRKPSVDQESVFKALRLMAAIGSAYDEHPETSQTDSSSLNETKPNKKLEKPMNPNNKANETGEETSKNLPSLPVSIADWPVFITENGDLGTLMDVVLPGAGFGELPRELQALLRPHFLKEDFSPVQRQQQQSSKFGKGKRGRRNNSNKQSSRKPPKKRIHHLLESSIFSIYGASVDSSIVPEGFEENSHVSWNKIAVSANSFLLRAREQLSTHIVDVPTAASNFLESYSANRNLSDDEISAILKLTQHAFKTSNHLLLSYVLVDDVLSPENTFTRLVRSTSAYIGKGLDETGPGSALEDFAGSKLQYLSSRYNSIIGDTSQAVRKKAIQLFAIAGVQTGISISVSLNSNIEKDKRLQEGVLAALPDRKLPGLRKNAAKADIYLPYGLGQVMNRRKYYLLDASLPMEWEKISKSMSPSSALGFISLLLAIPFDDATEVTPKTVVAAAKCLMGQTEMNADKVTPSETGKLSKDTPAPLKRRLYFLPPGQAGAKSINISKARLVEQLESIKWLPCAMPSHQQGSLTLLKPCETVLEFDSSRPEMPTVSIPPLMLKRLKSSPLTRSLTWGTQAPPPPLGELAGLAREAKGLLGVEGSFVDKDAVGACASRMFDTWNAVCRSHIRGSLNPNDKKTLQTLSKFPCIPVRRVVDSGGGNTNWIVTPDRCVRMPESIPDTKNEEQELRHLTIASLVAADYICDFSHSTHNPFFHQPELSKVVVHLAGIRSLAEIEGGSLVSLCTAFVRHLWAIEPNLSFRSSPLRDAFSFAMKVCLSRPQESLKLKQDVKVFVRHGPGIGTKTLPARWVPLKNGVVQPVLGDNKMRSSLLSPEMKIQLLGVLDHTNKEKDCMEAELLSNIDAQVLTTLGILRLSDKRFTVKTRARGTPSVITGASSKFQLVCALLKSMESENGLNNSSGKPMTTNGFLDWSYEPPLLIRHEALTREFRAPGMDAPTSIPLYAMFGRAPKVTKERCILVSGTADDYSMELEELVFDHIGVGSTLSVTQMKPYRAAARLLAHLENVVSFNKFVDRDFADFEATTAWKTLVRKKAILRKLDEAEKANERKLLRELLGEAEEIFDDDMDGGDSFLQSSRDLLVKLEEEWETEIANKHKEQEEAEVETGKFFDRAEGRGRGRCVDNRPAWMTTNGSEDKLAKNPAPNADEVGKSLERPLATGAIVETLDASGRGRGISNLPAWMTSFDGPSKTSEAFAINSQESIEKASLVSPRDEQAGDPLPKGKGRGMGRGVDNRPAWMATDTATVVEQSTLTTEDSAPLAPTIQAKSILSSILNDSSTAVFPETKDSAIALRDAVEAGRGRGRGVNNLPAWMTNNCESDGLVQTRSNDAGEKANQKRNRSPSPPQPQAEFMENADEPSTKKARKSEDEKWPSYTSSVKLDIDLVPSQKAEFMKWLETNAKKEVEVRGGTLKVSTEEDSNKTSW